MASPVITLFSGPHCHLCDQAEQLCWQAGLQRAQLNRVDVTERLDWKKAYGLRIPVLRREDTSAELGWPFSLEELQAFLAC